MKAGFLVLALVSSVASVKFAEEEIFKEKTILLACTSLMRLAIGAEHELVQKIADHPQQSEVTLWYIINGAETCVNTIDYDLAVEIFYKPNIRAKHYDDLYTLDPERIDTAKDWTLSQSHKDLLARLKSFT
mmetsp:Transcript_6408/g.11145  ORF Transcript_6408/g.11145 Transcript_6408/m.11145 type:complete len:131 (+) Transcript_6408:928-1320(+)